MVVIFQYDSFRYILFKRVEPYDDFEDDSLRPIKNVGLFVLMRHYIKCIIGFG